MKNSDKYMEKAKKLANDVLNITEAVNMLSTELLCENDKDRNNDKIRSIFYMLCSYCKEVDVRPKDVKLEIEKDENAQIEYDIPRLKY